MNLYKITNLRDLSIYYLGNSFSEVEDKRKDKASTIKIELIQTDIY